MDETTIADAQTAVAQAVVSAENDARESADDEVEAILDAAEARIDDATRAAQQIADAATMTALGQQFETLRQEFRTWLDALESLKMTVSQTQSEMAEAKAQISALALTAVSSLPAQSSLIQAPSAKIAEATQAVAEMLPENLSESVVVESPAPSIRKATRRWM